MDPFFLKLQTKLSTAIGDLSAEQTQLSPASKWSIQKIVEHLMLSYSGTESVLIDRISKGRPTQTKPTLRQHLGQLFVVRLGVFPAGRAAPDAVMPPPVSQALSGEQIRARYEEALRSMDGKLDEVSRMFGGRNRAASHFILGPLSPADWRRFHFAHGSHHIKQIDSIRRANRL